MGLYGNIVYRNHNSSLHHCKHCKQSGKCQHAQG